MSTDTTLECVECGSDIEADRAAKVYEVSGHPAQYCKTCAQRIKEQRIKERQRNERNAANRARNEALRVLCGTSAAAARRDMGMS